MFQHIYSARPKGAIGYAQQKALIITTTYNEMTEGIHEGISPQYLRLVDDEKLPLDNNRSERALRIIAIGRKNYLFAENDTAAENLAGLYSLIATCELHGINPEQYLVDVLFPAPDIHWTVQPHR